MEIKFGVKGIVSYKKFKRDGTVTGQGEFTNLILNNGLDLMGTEGMSTYLGRAHVGTGTTAPAVTDTALVAPVANVNRSSISALSSGGTPDWYHEYSAVFNFGEGVAEGNLTEFGISTTTNSFFARALFKDEFGDPTTVTVLSDEFLSITYKLRLYINTTDVTGVVTLEGNDYNYTIRPALVGKVSTGYWSTSLDFTYHDNMYAVGGGITAFTASPPSSGAVSATVNTAVYTPGNYYVDFVGYWQPSVANFGSGIGAITYCCQYNGDAVYALWQIGFSPKIPKTNTKKLGMTIRLSWDRV